MEVFVKAVEMGSFAAAAACLGLSAQRVGKQVATIERRLGVRLLNRSTRRQSLTEAGSLYFEGCKRALAEVDAAEARVAAQGETPRGTLRVTAPVAFGTVRLVPDSTRFLAMYPEVSLNFELTDRWVNLIEEGFDAAIRIGELSDSSLVTRALAPYRLIPCASPDYLRRKGMPRQPSDLRDHDCLDYAFAVHPAPALWHFRSASASIGIAPRGRLLVNDSRALIEAALNGAGIILAAELLLSAHLAAGRLVRVLADYEGPARPMQIIFAGHRAQAPKLRAFLDWAGATFAPRQSGP
ncbi:MAG: LysR family transcriptional regulator [Azospirillaceae bacterium]|nr:LysR family transcriptional regulator [Azospirillaceae bacterium]